MPPSQFYCLERGQLGQGQVTVVGSMASIGAHLALARPPVASSTSHHECTEGTALVLLVYSINQYDYLPGQYQYWR